MPLEDERSPGPSWEARRRFELERDISQRKSINKRLCESLERILGVLGRDEAEVKDGEQEPLWKRKHEALSSLSYIKDVLLNDVTEVEETRLRGEKGIRPRKLKDDMVGNQALKVTILLSARLAVTDSLYW